MSEHPREAESMARLSHRVQAVLLDLLVSEPIPARRRVTGLRAGLQLLDQVEDLNRPRVLVSKKSVPDEKLRKTLEAMMTRPRSTRPSGYDGRALAKSREVLAALLEGGQPPRRRLLACLDFVRDVVRPKLPFNSLPPLPL